MYVWCVRVVGKREDRVVVGETVKGQSDKFVRYVIVKNIRMLEDPTYVAARLTRLPTSTHKGRIYVKQVSKCNLFLCKPFDMSSLISCSNHCSSTVCHFVDCVGEVFVSSVSPSHIKW